MDEQTPTDRQPAAQPGGGDHRKLGDFELLREIGRGGMGVVYEARQISLSRRVALKVLPPGLGLTDQAFQRFQREAQAAAKLHHSHIVPVYAVGEEQGCHYYAMELIEGAPLTEILRELRGEGSSPLLQAAVSRIEAESLRGPAGLAFEAATVTSGSPAQDLPAQPRPEPSGVATSHGPASLADSSSKSRKWFNTAARLVADVAEALNYAHGRGIVHRDVKPANLLLSVDGRLCVTDFGLAQVAQEPGMTVSGSFLGTPAYMSPEQIAAGRIKVDHRTDIYSLGAVLYELLTLERPFPGESRDQILAGILTKEPRAPRRLNPRIPVDLETICLKALEKDPDRRYATARHMAEDLRAYLGRGLIAARRAGPLRRTAKWTRRHPVAVTVVVGVLSIAALAYGFERRSAAERAERAVAEARVLLGNGEYRQALARVEQALKLRPGMIEARRTRAVILLQMDHSLAAAKEAESLLKISQDDWTAHAVLGAAASWSGQWLTGVDVDAHARAVERLAPRSADGFFLRSLLATDAIEKLRLVDQALTLDPSHPLALRRRAQVLGSLLKDFPAARATAERLFAARPRSSSRLRLLASISFWEGDVSDALETIEKAIALDPQDAANYHARGIAYAAIEKYDRAIAEYTRAIALDPEVVTAYFQRSGSFLSLGRYDDAIRDARHALDINPDYFGCYMQLTWILAAAGRKDEAHQLFPPL